MSGRLPALNGKAVLSALQSAGFYVHHVKGSHHVLRHPGKTKLRVVVPVHRKDLPSGTLHSIIRQADLTVDDFLELL